MAALLATLLGLPRLFAADHADGTLEQMVLSPQPFALQVVGKVAAHWLVCGAAAACCWRRCSGCSSDLDADALGVLMLSLLLGTPLLSLVGASAPR